MILGGGITGRLAGYLWPSASILERNSEEKSNQLTRMWGTNYLWEPLPGFDCPPFKVTTEIDGQIATKDAILRYKEKIGKASESQESWGLQFQHVTTGYEFNHVPRGQLVPSFAVDRIDLSNQRVHAGDRMVEYSMLISTVPMSTLVSLVGFLKSDLIDRHLHHQPIYISLHKQLPEEEPSRDMYVNYLTDESTPVYRYCIRDGLQHAEQLAKTDRTTIVVNPGKIYYSTIAQSFLRVLRKRNVFCFGRFATWNSNELVHETYKKLRDFREAGRYETME